MVTTGYHKPIDPRLEPEIWWLRFPKHHPVTSPPTNQKEVHELGPSSQILPLKILPWKPLGSWDLLSTSCLFSSLAACNKHCIFLHYNTVSTNWLCCVAGEWTQIQLGNNLPLISTLNRIWATLQPSWQQQQQVNQLCVLVINTAWNVRSSVYKPIWKSNLREKGNFKNNLTQPF